MVKASEQKRPASAGQILYLSFMFCETKGMKKRRPIIHIGQRFL